MPFSFQAACLPLHLGALPYRSAAQALEASRTYAGPILTWPQLPQRSPREQSLAQSVGGFPGLVFDVTRGLVHVDRALATRDLDRLSLAYLEHDLAFAGFATDDAAGFAELQRGTETQRAPVVLKGQILGPISVAAQLTDEQQRPLMYDDVLFDAIVQYLQLRVAWQEKQLRSISATTIICLDEPFLDVVGQPFLPIEWERAHEQIDTVLGGIQGARAIYAAGAVEWANAITPGVDIIIADAYGYAHALVAAAPALVEFVDRGGVIGFGLVPTDEDLLGRVTPQALEQRFDGLVAELTRAGVDKERLLRQSLVAPNNTLGHVSIGTAERALGMLDSLSRSLRQRHNLGN